MTRPRLVIVKLGGAAITDKSQEETLCTKGLAAAAAAIGAAFRENGGSLGKGTRFVVVHGAGSFGHQAASREGFSSSSPISTESNAGDPGKSAAAVARVRASCGRLHSAVVSSLVTKAAATVIVGTSSIDFAESAPVSSANTASDFSRVLASMKPRNGAMAAE